MLDSLQTEEQETRNKLVEKLEINWKSMTMPKLAAYQTHLSNCGPSVVIHLGFGSTNSMLH